jgi:prepilin-type N-terminal cleavage/methylation domain-containing protein
MPITQTYKQGFTLVEMIVSLAIFSIVVTVSVGALLVLVGTNQQLQGEQSVMTNLSFALDSMTREIRTGGGYYCVSGSSNVFNNGVDLDTELTSGGFPLVQDCLSGNQNNSRLHGLAIVEGGDSITDASDRILYFFDNVEKKIYRRVGAGPAESIVSSGIVIEELEFFVSGSKPQSACPTPITAACRATIIDQPTVTLFIKAKEKDIPTAKPYYLQTTITQRTLDV